MLKDWLQRSGAVGARYAREVLGRVPQTGARSTNAFWDKFSRSMVAVGDGPDEVSAVAAGAIRKAPAAKRAFLEARTLVIDTEEAGRDLAVADRYGYIVSPGANRISGLLSSSDRRSADSGSSLQARSSRVSIGRRCAR